MIALYLAFAASAIAADPLVHTGGDAGALAEKAAKLTGRAAADFRPISLAEMFAGRGPGVLRSGALESCGGAPAQEAAFAAALKDAEGSLAYMEYSKAAAGLDAALAAMVCLDRPVDPALAGRMHYLRGLVAWQGGQKDAAAKSFRQAHTFHPGLTWDDTFAPDPKPTFEQAAREAEERKSTTTLGLVPPPAEGSLWLDGRAVAAGSRSIAIADGDHLVQAAGGTWRLQLEAGAQAILVLPAAIPSGALAWADDAEMRDSLSAVLAWTLGEGTRTYVDSGSTLWSVAAGSKAWESLGKTGGVAAGREGGHHVGAWLLGGGGAVAVLGGAMTTLGYLGAKSAADDAAGAATPADYDTIQQDRYEPAASQIRTWRLVAGGGALLAATGLLLLDERWGSIAPALVDGAPGAMLVLRP